MMRLLWLLPLLLQGCASWPPGGEGGMAESRPTAYPRGEAEREAWQTFEQRQMAIDDALHRLDALGYQACLPAGKASLMALRRGVLREAHSRLWVDAWRHQGLLASEVEQERSRLVWWQEQTGCGSWSGRKLNEWGAGSPPS
ncbi:hypothetical protein ACKC5O_04970 [Aeromonas schubertii]|uniref:hypothetical protein n=1 Tax=Aeromonas schubertii TaxID=652 RepID=UPI001CC8294D|nr:hypothetical protein [Aeromonas schubertii]MBZ6072010.1 hypothetical protein [Aeromonas schubertii]